MNADRPIVLTLSGHDPSGGAGIQADIEAIASRRCHAVSVITALTDQDSRNVRRVIPQPAGQIINQALTLLKDIKVQAIKIGLLGHADVVSAVHAVLGECPGIPVIFDPVLAAGGGAELANNDLIAAIVDLLLPHTTVLTPNSLEARRLAVAEELDRCGISLLAMGCAYVLITGTHEATDTVCNHLYCEGRLKQNYSWQRLPHSYHGSGCTLAASIAALIAKGHDVTSAIADAQSYTWNALNAGFKPGQGQHFPNRLYSFAKS